MLRALSLCVTFLLFSIPPCLAQSPSPAQSPASTAPAKPDARSAPVSAPTGDSARKKPKKVWTNDDVSSLGGAISVVGDSNSTPDSSAKQDSNPSAASARDRKVAAYRDQLRQLQTQLDVTGKKLSDLQNFNGNNASGSGGVNVHQHYSMTPVAGQIKQLEEKKKQLQDQVDAVQDAARKDGIEPGELR
jgi:hypothetical protein